MNVVGKERLVNINLRGLPFSLRQSLKVRAKKCGMTMASYCVKVLENEVGSGNPVRAGGGSFSGGKVVLGADDAAVMGIGCGGAGGRSEGDSAGGVEPGDQGSGADCGGRVGLGDGQGDSEAGEAAPQAVTQAEYDGMMEQVVLTIDSELRKDAGLPPYDPNEASAAAVIAGKDKSWVGGSRDIDPFNPEDVKAFQERDKQAAEMLAPAPEIDPVVFKTLEAMRVAGEKAFGATLENIERLRAEDSHAKLVAAHSHVLSSFNPTPRVVDTAKEAAETALRMKKPPAAKKENRKCKFCGAKMERWSATTLRCTACTRNEAL